MYVYAPPSYQMSVECFMCLSVGLQTVKLPQTFGVYNVLYLACALLVKSQFSTLLF